MNLRKNDLVKMFEEASKGYLPEFLNKILIPSGRGGVYAARDYITANCILAEIRKAAAEGKRVNQAEIKSKDDLKSILHPVTRFRLSMYTPMLAFRYDELTPQLQKKQFDDPDIIATTKQNGVRGVFIYSAGRSVLYSRNYSQKDCSLPEYWKNVAQEFKGDLPFAVDCEVKFEPDCDVQQELERFGLTTDSKLEAMSALLQMESSAAVKLQEEYERIHGKPLIVFRLITVLYYNGKDYRKRPLGEAYAVESEVVKYATERGLNLAQIKKVKGTRADKEAFLDAMLEQGEEGVVFHNLKSRYITTENRDRNGFVKLKRSVSDTLAKNGMGDTIDGFITGFTMSKPGTADEGLIGSYEISAYIKDAKGNKRKQVIAYVPNIPREQKIQFTTMDAEGNPTLEPMLYGQVVEVNGQEVSRVSKRLTHPRLLRMRYDKNEEDCVYTEEFWNSQMDVSLTEVSRKYNKDI